MSINRREFVQMLAIAAAAGLPLASRSALANGDGKDIYRLPRFGNVSLLHMTDSHAQLTPVYYREPQYNIGVAAMTGQPPHLVGDYFLKYYGMKPGTRDAHAFTYLDFTEAARHYGKVGGYAHIATLVKQLRAERPGALLLDGGDTWQGSGLSLWTQGQDMVDAQVELGVDVMTGHWEFTYGMERVKALVDGPLKQGKVDFVAQNVITADFGDEVFQNYSMREINGVQVAIIGQAFPYTPIAHPRRFVADWSFGIQDDHLQQVIDEVRKKGAQAVVLLSHNGMDVDLKLASRVSGLDAIMGGHTHDGVPKPVIVKNSGGQTLVTNAGSNGKYIGVLDFDVKNGKVRDWRYHLLPVFSNLLKPDAAMTALIDKHRKPYAEKLDEVLATTDGLLYRRGNFNGSFDQLILDALVKEKDAEIAFSPGFRWGTTLLPGDAITMERVLDQTAITYPQVTVNEFSGAQIKAILEDVCDNIFNPDPYYQQGGDMVRVGGMTYTCSPSAESGQRINDMRFGGEPMDAGKTYKVAGWAPVGDGIHGEAVWDVVARHLRGHGPVTPITPVIPALVGMQGNPGIGS